MIEIVAGLGAAAVWISCGVLAYGLNVGFCSREFTGLHEPGYYKYAPLSDERISQEWSMLRWSAGFMFLLGPFGLVGSILGTIPLGWIGKHGLRFRR